MISQLSSVDQPVSIPVWLIRLMSLLINPVLADLISLLQEVDLELLSLCDWCTPRQLADISDLPQRVGCTGWSTKLWL